MWKFYCYISRKSLKDLEANKSLLSLNIGLYPFFSFLISGRFWKIFLVSGNFGEIFVEFYGPIS